MSDYTQLVPRPARTAMNTGLSAARQSTMLDLLGTPGHLTRDCSEVTNETLSAHIIERNVGPFTVSGLDVALHSLETLLAEVKATQPELYDLLGTAGMLCCRAVRHSHTLFSNHSWGTAIDLTIGGVLAEQGATRIPRGLVAVYPFFHAHGWFWGAGYRTLADPMHFELADETMQDLFGGGRDVNV